MIKEQIIPILKAFTNGFNQDSFIEIILLSSFVKRDES